MFFLCKIFKCQCGCEKESGKKESCQCGCHKHGKKIVLVLGMILVAAIVIVSILRERIVSENQDQTTIYGQGKVAYIPDVASIIVGVQIDKAVSAQEAMKQINEKIAKIIAAVKTEGISEGDIQTSNFSLNPQYDYIDGKTIVSGFNANQQVIIKAKGVDKNKEIAGKVVSAANNAGANQILGVNFSVSDINGLKQQARIKAIEEARAKSEDLFKAAGMKNQRIVSWYENLIQSPDAPSYNSGYGLGGGEAMASKSAPVSQVLSGTQEIIIEIGIVYKDK
jgi:uncharacterized protein